MTFFLSGKRYSYTGSLQLLRLECMIHREQEEKKEAYLRWEKRTCPFFSYVNIKSAEIRVNFFERGAVIQLKMQLFTCSSQCAWGSLSISGPWREACPSVLLKGWLPKSQHRRWCQRRHWVFWWPVFSATYLFLIYWKLVCVVFLHRVI